MIPTYIAYIHDDDKPTARIKIRAWSFDSARRKAYLYFKPENLLDLIVRRV